jgi:hypothetical protein
MRSKVIGFCGIEGLPIVFVYSTANCMLSTPTKPNCPVQKRKNNKKKRKKKEKVFKIVTKWADKKKSTIFLFLDYTW